MLRLNNTKFYC